MKEPEKKSPPTYEENRKFIETLGNDLILFDDYLARQLGLFYASIGRIDPNANLPKSPKDEKEILYIDFMKSSLLNNTKKEANVSLKKTEDDLIKDIDERLQEGIDQQSIEMLDAFKQAITTHREELEKKLESEDGILSLYAACKQREIIADAAGKLHYNDTKIQELIKEANGRKLAVDENGAIDKKGEDFDTKNTNLKKEDKEEIARRITNEQSLTVPTEIALKLMFDPNPTGREYLKQLDIATKLMCKYFSENGLSEKGGQSIYAPEKMENEENKNSFIKELKDKQLASLSFIRRLSLYASQSLRRKDSTKVTSPKAETPPKLERSPKSKDLVKKTKVPENNRNSSKSIASTASTGSGESTPREEEQKQQVRPIFADMSQTRGKYGTYDITSEDLQAVVNEFSNKTKAQIHEQVSKNPMQYDLIDKNGKTIMDYACENKNLELVAVLLDHGMSLDFSRAPGKRAPSKEEKTLRDSLDPVDVTKIEEVVLGATKKRMDEDKELFDAIQKVIKNKKHLKTVDISPLGTNEGVVSQSRNSSKDFGIGPRTSINL